MIARTRAHKLERYIATRAVDAEALHERPARLARSGNSCSVEVKHGGQIYAVIADIGRFHDELSRQSALYGQVPGFYVRLAKLQVDIDVAGVSERSRNRDNPARRNRSDDRRRKPSCHRGESGAEAAWCIEHIILQN